MNTFASKDNLIKAGAVTVAVMIAINLTATKSKLIQGAAAVVAAAIALPLASKIA